MMITVSAAMIFSLIIVTGLISPTMAATMKEVPLLSSVLNLQGILVYTPQMKRDSQQN